MAVTLIGEIVNSCDATTGFSVGNISGDDDFVEGSGALGLKASNTTVELYTTTLGATAPYDFSSTGGEDGYHIIMWFNTKTPINATTGLTIIVGNGTDRGRWNVLGSGFYKGGFVTRVIDSAADFNTIAAGTWTTTGNPAQLSNITQMGGGFTTTTSIMGSFNNVQIDQITIGEGLRVDAGTVGTPNTFETVRAADEDTAFYGWWSSANGGIIGKGKLYIGPVTGTATSVFTDTAFKVTFADELVAVGFYEISTRGTNTDITWTLGNISAADSANSRWSLTIDSTTNTFDDTNSVLSGFDIFTLNSTTTFTGTTLIDGNSIIQNGATLDSCSFLDGNNANGVALIEADTAANISDCVFESGSVGHAIEIAPTGAGPHTINLSGNQFSGYAGTDGSTGNEAILINPATASADITLNIVGGGSTPSIMEAAGYTGTFTLVVSPVTLTVKVTTTTGTNIQNARVIALVSDGTNFPFDATVTATSSGTTATITHTAHGLESNDYVQITGANEENYNGAFQITVTGANTYTYTMTGTATSPATGTLKCTTVLLTGLTDVNGEISDTRSYGVNQAITGRVRKSSGSPYYKTSGITGTIDKDSGLTANIQLIGDE